MILSFYLILDFKNMSTVKKNTDPQQLKAKDEKLNS